MQYLSGNLRRWYKLSEKEATDKIKNFSENYIIISSRKIDFVVKFIKNLASEKGIILSPDAISRIVDIVAKLEPILFLSPRELKENRIYLNTPMEELDRNRIGEKIADGLGAIDE